MSSILAENRRIMSPGVQTALSVITDIAVWIPAAPLAVGLLRFRSTSLALRFIIVFTGIALLSNNLLYHYGNKEVFIMYVPRIYTLIEFSLISLFFFLITTRKKFRIAMICMFVPFTAVVIIDFLVEGILKRDDLSVGVESLVFMIYSLVTLYHILKDAEYPNLLATAEFWIISGILLYFGGNIFVFVSSNYMASVSRDLYIMFWGIHAIICILFYSVLVVGLWKKNPSR